MITEIKTVEDYRKAELIKAVRFDDFEEPVQEIKLEKVAKTDKEIGDMIDNYKSGTFRLFAYEIPKIIINADDDDFLRKLFKKCCDADTSVSHYPSDLITDCIVKIKQRFKL